MKNYSGKHRLVVGDVHSPVVDAKDGTQVKFDRKLYSSTGGVGCLIRDIGESKSNPTDQMEYSRKKGDSKHLP